MVWIALAGGLAVIGVIVWSFRRNASRAEEPALHRSPRGWADRLDENGRVAFREGLRAYQDKVGPLDVGEDRGVLTVRRPPALVSLYLLADRFAERGPEGLYDPEETVRQLVTSCLAAEQPGVLHLRPGWLDGEIDGLDRGAFAAAVREIVCPDRDGCRADPDAGLLEVAVAPEGGDEGNTLLLDLARVLDAYEKLRADRPGMPARALLRDVLFRLLTEDGPGLAWTRPPTARHRATVLAAGPTERRPAS
ncbi:hypothetical protein AB0J42_14965 [Nonomuraea sp. NPDC049649]|uniref:hypothetical protein n=1 Tax=Nonomuraea sp. NPDC049649 TaxID=3155776 RepID=UPI003424FC18